MMMHRQAFSPRPTRHAVLCLSLSVFLLGLGPTATHAGDGNFDSCDTSVFIGEKSTYAIQLHFFRSMIPASNEAPRDKRREKYDKASSPVELSVHGIQHYEEDGKTFFLARMAARSFKWFDKLFSYKEDIYSLAESDLSKTRRSWEESRMRKSPLKKKKEKEVNFEIDWNDPPTVMSYKDQKHRYTFPSVAREKPGPLPNSLDLVSGFFSARCRDLEIGDQFSINYIDRKRNFEVRFEVIDQEEIYVPALLDPVWAYHLVITSGHVQYGKPKIKPEYDLHAWIETAAPHRLLYASGKASNLGSATFEMVDYSTNSEVHLVPPAPVWLSAAVKD